MLTDIKKLDTEEGRREYYKYDMSDPSTFRHHAEPYLDPSFNNELKEVYGCDHNGDPRFRIVWAGTLPAPAFRDDGKTVIEYEGKKYPFMRLRGVKGFTYINDDGHKVTVTTLPQVPKDKIWAPEVTWEDLGIMKFAIEQKYTAEEMVQLGWYPPFDSPEFNTWCVRDGKRYRAKPSPTGDYIKACYIDTHDGQYRDVTQLDVDQIHAIVARAQNESEEEYVARKQEERLKLSIVEQEDETFNYVAQVDKSIVAAERRMARGQVAYSK